MVSFIDAFFQNGGEYFPFLYLDEVVREFFHDKLPYLLATCIAAWAIKYVTRSNSDTFGLMMHRYNDIPEFSKADARLVSNKYIAHAKVSTKQHTANCGD